MKKCPFCAKGIDAIENTCNSCGQRAGQIFVPILALIIFFHFFTFDIQMLIKGEFPIHPINISTKGETDPIPLILEKYDIKNQPDSPYTINKIVGSIKNSSSKEFSYAQIEFTLYDGYDAQVGTAIANINNLEPNAKWNFEAHVFQDNARKAKFKKIICY